MVCADKYLSYLCPDCTSTFIGYPILKKVNFMNRQRLVCAPKNRTVRDRIPYDSKKLLGAKSRVVTVSHGTGKW
jgi:hypothetical protein